MPSSPNYKRDYKQERRTAIKRGETGVGSKSSDAKRHRARRAAIKAGIIKKGSKSTVDHKKPISKGGSNSTSNLRARSFSKNSQDGGKMGNRKGKAAGGRKGKH